MKSHARSVSSQLPPSAFTYTSPAESLTHRSRLASLISPLRRVVPRVPFWKLAAHRVPVLWGLYRGLLRSAPTEEIRWQVKTRFRKDRHLTSPAETKVQMLRGYRLLDVCAQVKQGNERLRLLLDRYSRLIAANRENAKFAKMLEEQQAHMRWLRSRPIITGYFRPSIYNKPLPRLRPQPPHISMMIARRRRNRDRRNVQYAELKELRALAREEADFEERLMVAVRNGEKAEVRKGFGLKKADAQPFKPVFLTDLATWDQPILSTQAAIRNGFARDSERSLTPFPPELLERIAAAKQERIANKRREYEREARGEVLNKTIRRARQGPPAWILETMSENQIRMDQIARSSVSEVGYIGHIKKKLGWKLKDPDPWSAEDGRGDQEVLAKLEKDILEENKRRRASGLSSRAD